MGEVIPVTMVRDNLDNIPDYPLPDGFSIRKFRNGDGSIWTQVGAAAGTFVSLDVAQERFDKEFKEPVNEMEDRCFFIQHDESGQVAGTAMAWFAPEFVPGENYGRVHWVAIVPEFQGKGLAKPLMSAVLKRLAQSHDKAVLGTQTFRVKAVKLYLDLGFRPFLKESKDEDIWREFAKELNHPALESSRRI